MRKLRNPLAIVLIAVLAISFTGCHKFHHRIEGEGPVVSEEFTFDEIHSISLHTVGNLHLTQSDNQEVIIEAQQNIIDVMELKYNNGKLEIDIDEHIIDFSDIDIYISVADLTKVKLTGTGDVNTTNQFLLEDDLELKLTGTGDFNIDVEAPRIYVNCTGVGDFDMETTTDYLECDMSGTGNYTLKGEATKVNYEYTGAGDIYAFNLITKETYLDISGVCDAEVNVNDILDIRISGSGDIYYKGNPAITTSISGSGDVVDSN